MRRRSWNRNSLSAKTASFSFVSFEWDVLGLVLNYTNCPGSSTSPKDLINDSCFIFPSSTRQSQAGTGTHLKAIGLENFAWWAFLWLWVFSEKSYLLLCCQHASKNDMTRIAELRCPLVISSATQLPLACSQAPDKWIFQNQPPAIMGEGVFSLTGSSKQSKPDWTRIEDSIFRRTTAFQLSVQVRHISWECST